MKVDAGLVEVDDHIPLALNGSGAHGRRLADSPGA
jgi:hypothetical protein